MNKQTFDERFENEVLPHIVEQFEQDGFIDIPARQFAYNHEKDVLCKNNEITAKQYHDWIIPDKFTMNYRKEVVEVKSDPEIHRRLNSAEENEFRKWARNNYTLGNEIKTIWHPVVIHEIGIMYYEQHKNKK